MRAVGILVSGVLLATACTNSGASHNFTVRDSAGVTIVESAEPRWASESLWMVDSTPLLDLATTATGPNHEFSQVSDAVRLADGSIAVADAGSSQVRQFTPEGEFAWALGRTGGGPGEFQQLSNLTRLPGDSIVAFDYWLGRLTVISARGSFGREVHAVRPGPGVEKLLALTDSTFVAQFSEYDEMDGQAGLFRVPARILRLSTGGGVVDTIATIRGTETFIIPTGAMRPLFPRMGHMTADDGRVYVGSAEQLAYAVYSTDGGLERIVRVPDFDLRVSADEIQRERDAMLGPRPSARARSMADALPAPTTRPAYAQLVVDTTGAVWAAGFRAFADTVGPTPWQLFTPDGEWLGSTMLPRRLRVFEIGRDYLLGVNLDSLDVERVQLLRLRRERF